MAKILPAKTVLYPLPRWQGFLPEDPFLAQEVANGWSLTLLHLGLIFSQRVSERRTTHSCLSLRWHARMSVGSLQCWRLYIRLGVRGRFAQQLWLPQLQKMIWATQSLWKNKQRRYPSRFRRRVHPARKGYASRSDLRHKSGRLLPVSVCTELWHSTDAEVYTRPIHLPSSSPDRAP